MINVSDIEKAIAKQLTPLRLALEQDNILVAALPKLSSAYSSDAGETIDIIVSKATGIVPPDGFVGFQDINYTITIYVSLGLRYQDSPDEKNVLDWVCEQIYKLLYGFEMPDSKTAFMFVDYTPLRPENGQWSAQIQFSFTKQARTSPPINEGSLGIEFVRLFGQGVLPNDTTLIEEFTR